MDDAGYRRYSRINLPHARTVAGRLERTLVALAAFGEDANGGDALGAALARLLAGLDGFDEDPPGEQAILAADQAAVAARALVDALIASETRHDRLGQHVRNLFECLGLPEEGAELSLLCGERPDSPLR